MALLETPAVVPELRAGKAQAFDLRVEVVLPMKDNVEAIAHLGRG